MPSCGNTLFTYLQADHNRIQAQHRLPVLSQDVQAYVALEIYVRVVYLLYALHLGWIVRVIWRDDERKDEAAILVHPLVRLDGQREIQYVVGVGEVCPHRATERELAEI